MKSFIISVSLFAILIIGILINAAFIRNTCDYMSDTARALSTPTEEELSALEQFWEKEQELIGLSISSAYLDSVGRIIISMRCAYDMGDAYEFEKNRAMLADAAEEICRTEQLSLKNIF